MQIVGRESYKASNENNKYVFDLLVNNFQQYHLTITCNGDKKQSESTGWTYIIDGLDETFHHYEKKFSGIISIIVFDCAEMIRTSLANESSLISRTKKFRIMPRHKNENNEFWLRAQSDLTFRMDIMKSEISKFNIFSVISYGKYTNDADEIIRLRNQHTGKIEEYDYIWAFNKLYEHFGPLIEKEISDVFSEAPRGITNMIKQYVICNSEDLKSPNYTVPRRSIMEEMMGQSWNKFGKCIHEGCTNSGRYGHMTWKTGMYCGFHTPSNFIKF